MDDNKYCFDRVQKSIRSKLPIQNPLQTFVHNNILMMFEEKKFHTALRDASFYYQGRPYREEDFFLNHYKSGRITEKDIDDVYDDYFANYTDIKLPKGLEQEHHFWKKVLYADHLRVHPRKVLTVTNQNIWQKAYELFQNPEERFAFTYRRSLRLKAFWREQYDEYMEQYSYPLLIRLLSSFLDQGMSFWPNPFAKKGLWSFFLYGLKETATMDEDWVQELNQKVTKHLEQGHSVSEILEQELNEREIGEDQKENYLLELLFDLKGWSGMINKLELEPTQAPLKAPRCSLEEYTAIILLIENTLNQYLAKKYSLDLFTVFSQADDLVLSKMECSLLIYEMSKLTSDSVSWVNQLTTESAHDALIQLMTFNRHHRLPLWQEAYEQHFYKESLNAFISHQKKIHLIPTKPKFQYAFCMDDREESIRRHVEEVDPESATYGVVGFFNVDMKFAGINQRRLIAQCPPVVTPRKIVREVSSSQTDSGDKLQHTHDNWGRSLLSVYYNSRTLIRGFLVSLILGLASFIPLTMKVLMPETTSRLRRKALKKITPTPKTKLLLDANPHNHGEGYTKEEMADIVQSIFNICDFMTGLSPLVVMVAHGASSSNNPFKQAYGCGACGGNQGLPNGRAFAMMANDPKVREILASRGMAIPESTYVLGAFHDTTTDEITLLDLEAVPSRYDQDLVYIKKVFKEACERNALERCQRFNSSTAKNNQKFAQTHVKERAEDLAQPRPEYGHNRVALAVVGSRNLTKDFYLNRRSFLCSYNWKHDPSGDILAQIVLAAVPVTVNINMDYYFSHVDNEVFGSGSKLPLNVTSLIGVMTGARSDLRIGLARQMIEIHEPMRILVIIEAPKDRIMKIIDNHPRMKRMTYNLWMKLVIKDPETNEMLVFNGVGFDNYEGEEVILPQFKTSKEVSLKTRSDVDFAEVAGGNV